MLELRCDEFSFLSRTRLADRRPIKYAQQLNALQTCEPAQRLLGAM